MPAWRRLGIPAAVLAGLSLLPPLVVGDDSYGYYVLNLIAIYAIAAIGLNLLIGVAGLISLGHAAFMAIGAYTSALLTIKAGWPIWLSLPAAAVVTGGVGLLLGLPALRLYGHFLALATLSFGVAVPQIILKWDGLTGGAMGLLPPKPAFGPLVLDSEREVYYLVLALGAFLVWVAYNVLNSRPGRALKALRDSEVAARSMGINLAWYKTGAFALSAVYAGVAGALYGHLVGFIDPQSFNILISFQLIAMVVVGGLGSIPGAIYGAVLLTWLPLKLSRLQGLTAVIEGSIIILIVLFLPWGLASIPQRLRALRGGRGRATPESVSEEEVAGRAAAGGS